MSVKQKIEFVLSLFLFGVYMHRCIYSSVFTRRHIEVSDGLRLMFLNFSNVVPNDRSLSLSIALFLYIEIDMGWLRLVGSLK